MRTIRTVARLVGILVAFVPAWVPAADSAKSAALSPADQKLLDGLMKQFLFDPKGAQYVRVKAKCHTVWATAGEIAREGWLVQGKDGKPAQVIFTDGESMPAPAEKGIETLNFVEICRKRYPDARKAAAAEEDDTKAVFRQMERTALGGFEPPDLALAAWLYRFDQPELAAKALEKAAEARGSRGNESGTEKPDARMLRIAKEELAWTAFSEMVHAYMVRADGEALAHGERLLRLYGDVAKREYPQAEAIFADLKRRKAKGTFGKTPSVAAPKDYYQWSKEKKIAWLIDALDEVDVRQWGQPGGVALGMDFRVQDLIAMGDDAVPALIDAVEKDERLTRSVHFWRDFSHDRTVLGVREAALTAVMSIIKVRVFEPGSTGDNFTRRGQESAVETAKALRKYWKTYGGMPFEQRMMKTLANPQADSASRREAAMNLGHMGEKRTLATTVFSDWLGSSAQKPHNPAVAKFNNPTVAEAILAAMDSDLAKHDAGPHDQLYGYHRRGIEDGYLEPLVSLGDKRIAGELARRCKSAGGLRMRRKFALACHELGDSGPLNAFAHDVEAGLLKLPENNEPNTNDDDQPGNVELNGIVNALVHAGTPECDRALYAMAAAGHPFYRQVARQVLRANARFGGDESSWLAHPFCLAILRKTLDDSSPTGDVWKIAGDSLTCNGNNGSSSQSIPDYLKDASRRRQQAEERVCDRAAVKIAELIYGLPEYNPLLNDADARLAKIKDMLDRYRGHFRLLSPQEIRALGVNIWNPMFVPAILPLEHPATRDDFEHGRAVFHLDGKGKLAGAKLPAAATLRKTQKPERAVKVLIVQAEIGADGKTTYGIIGDGDIRAARADELSGIATIAGVEIRKVK